MAAAHIDRKEVFIVSGCCGCSLGDEDKKKDMKIRMWLRIPMMEDNL